MIYSHSNEYTGRQKKAADPIIRRRVCYISSIAHSFLEALNRKSTHNSKHPVCWRWLYAHRRMWRFYARQHV